MLNIHNYHIQSWTEGPWDALQDIPIPKLGSPWFFLAVALVLLTGVQIDKTIESIQQRQPRKVMKNLANVVLSLVACNLVYEYYTTNKI